jgi:hypothetical protein
MSEDSLWARLIESLDAWTAAKEIAPGRIEVALPPNGGTSGRVQMVMTPDEWNEMEGVMFGNFDDALQDIKQTLLELGPDEKLVVYEQYRLMPSSAVELPERQDAEPEAGGEWVVLDRQGHLASRFRDWLESDDAAE